MIQCFDILIGCNSALIRIRSHPDPVKIRIQLDLTAMDPVGSGSGQIQKYGSRCTPNLILVTTRNKNSVKLILLG